MIKEKFYPKKIYNGLGKALSKFPFTPTFYTALSFISGIAGFVFVYFQNIIFSVLSFSLSGMLDICDGALAKKLKKTSAKGAFIDGISDRFVDFFIVFSFLFLGLPDILIPIEILVAVLMFVTIMPSFVVAYANHRELVDDPHETKVWRIMHRGEMYSLYIIALFLVSLDKIFSVYLLYIIGVLNIITIIQTIYLSFKHKS